MMQFIDERCECETDGWIPDSYFVVGETFRSDTKKWRLGTVSPGIRISCPMPESSTRCRWF